MDRRTNGSRRTVWLLLLALVLAVPAVAHAQGKTLYWEQYYTDITVQTSGDLNIEERQTIQFTSGTFTYGYRTIPTDKTEGVSDVQVWEGGRQYTQSPAKGDYTFTVNQNGDELVVYWYFPQTTQSTRTFTFRYTVHGGIRINERQGDSLFWKAIPPDHSFPIQDGRATVRLPSGADLGDIVSHGAEATASVEGSTVTFSAIGQLPAGQELEIGVAFGPGLIQAEKPGWQSKEETGTALSLVFGVLGAVVLVGGLSGVLLLWYQRGRDPEVGLVAELLNEPPSDLPPGIAGTLVDERADLQDVVASIVDLARRGYLDMVETRASRGLLGLGSGSEFTFRRTDKVWDDLEAFERTILEKIFGGGYERSLDDLRNQFYSAIPKIKRGLYEVTVSRKFFRTDPDTVRGRYAGAGVALLLVTGGVGFLTYTLLANAVSAVICPFAAAGLVAVAVIVTGQAMPVKTRQGAEETARWKAFRRYLQEIERHTKLEEATSLFDRYLPYAIAFGLERTWINKFASMPSTPIPLWYFPIWMGSGSSGRSAPHPSGASGGGHMPSLDGMSRGMATGLSGISAGLVSMLNATSTTLVSRPQSTGGGGGWSGGGFSAGGGGGGGSAGFG